VNYTGYCIDVIICESCGYFHKNSSTTPLVGGHNPHCLVCGEMAVDRFTYDWTDNDGNERPDREQKCLFNNRKGFSEDYWVFWEQVMCRE